MIDKEEIHRLKQRLAEMETDNRHLSNELRVTRWESEEAANKYFEICHHLDERVKARTNELEKLNSELREALATVKKLSGLLPICASCKKIRDNNGSWNRLEVYLKEHSEAEFSHGICPECAQRLYPDLNLGDFPLKK